MRKHILAAAAALLGLLPLAASAQEYPPDDGPPQAQQGPYQQQPGRYQSDVGPGDNGPNENGPEDGPGDVGPGPGGPGPGPSYAEQPPAGAPSVDEQLRGRVTDFDGAYNLTVRDDRGFVDNIQLHPGTIINPTGLTLAPGMVVSILGDNAGQYFSANEIDTPYSIGGYDAVPVYEGRAWDSYGPSFSLDFFFGNVGWWHGNDFRGGYHYDGGARVYRDAYRGGYRSGYDTGRRYGSNGGSYGRGYQRGSYGSTQSSNGVRYGRGYNGSATTQANSVDSGTRRYETRGYANAGAGYTGTHGYTNTNRTYSEAPNRTYPQTRSYASGAGRSYSSGGRTSGGGGRTYSQSARTSGGGGSHGGGGHDGGSGGHDHR